MFSKISPPSEAVGKERAPEVAFGHEGASDAADGGEIFENCIVKNFHVSKYESGCVRAFPCSYVMQFRVTKSNLKTK